MAHLFCNCERSIDGTVTIPRALVSRWERQMATAYDDLSEVEKRSDLVEADRILSLLDEHADDT